MISTDKKYVGRLDKVLLMSINLLAFQRNFLFQPVSLLSNRLITGSQLFPSLYLVPRGMPRYLIASCVLLQPNTWAREVPALSTPIPTSSYLIMLILRPKTAWKQRRIHLKLRSMLASEVIYIVALEIYYCSNREVPLCHI